MHQTMYWQIMNLDSVRGAWWNGQHSCSSTSCPTSLARVAAKPANCVYVRVIVFEVLPKSQLQAVQVSGQNSNATQQLWHQKRLGEKSFDTDPIV